jgi:large repetitive protein
MNLARIITILLSIINFTSCGVNVSESGKTISAFIRGSVSPLKGLISHHSPQHFQLVQNAYSAACPAGVSVNIHPLDSDGLIDFGTIIASAPLQSDTSFSIPRSKLPELDQPTIRYMARVIGCNDRILMRPLTSTTLTNDGEDIIQDISYTTTLISASHNANISKKLSQVLKQQIEELFNAVGSSSSEVEAFNTISTNTTIASRFEQVFDSVPTVLQSAAPKVDLVVPTSIPENMSSEFRAVAHHWNPNYDIAYLWKINGTSISTNAAWNFSPGANDQGTHTITLYVGKDDGAGEIDLNQPYTLNSFQLQIQNTVLPVAPILSLDTVEHPSTTINQTLVHLLLNTGAEQMNCQSFSALALSESSVMPSSSAAFNIECDTNFSQELTYTISPADGVKTLSLWAIDSAGVISLTPKTLTLTLDRSPPILSFPSLASALRGGQNYLIEWNSSDVSGIAEHKLYYSVDGSDYTLIADGLSGQSHLWNVPAIDTSTLTFKLEAIDTIGNQSEIISSNIVVDSTPPTIAIISPAAGTTTQGFLTVTGACESGAQNIIVTGDINQSVSAFCSNGNFTASIMLSGADGSKNITIAQTDQVGNSSSQVRSFIKDTTPPSIQITSHTDLDESNTDINLAGTCEADLDVIISGDTNSSTVSCTAGSFNHVLNLSGADGTKSIQASQTDAAGNSAFASVNLIKDTTSPTITSLSINSGETQTNNRNIVISLSATSNRSDISSFCFKVNDNVQPANADSCWKDLESIAMNITNELHLTNFPFQVGFTLGTYNIYAWTRDQLGNTSTLNEVAQVDTSSIDFSPTPPAVISSIIASSVANPTSPLTSDDTTALAGSDLYVFWTIQDDNPIPDNGISLFWTADETNYTELVTNLSDNANGACSLTGGYTGCAVLPTASPSNNYFKIQISVTNQEALQSLSTSNPLNTGNFNLLSGNTSLGIGGSASSAVIFTREELVYGQSHHAQFVVTPLGDIFIYFLGRGLAHISSTTGEIRIIAPETGTSSGDYGPLSNATFRNIYRVQLSHDNNLLIWDRDRVRAIDLSLPEWPIKTLFGGGNDHSDGASALSAQLPTLSHFYPMFTPLPDGKIYFEKGREIWFFDPDDQTVKKHSTLTGFGIDDMTTGTRSQYEWDNCSSENTVIGYNINTSSLSKIIRKGRVDTQEHCGSHTRSENSFTGNFDLNSGEAVAPHPPQTPWSSVNFTGMDGRIYSASRWTQIRKYDQETNSMVTLAGVHNTTGRCADGTLATSCPIHFKSVFVDKFGKVYFIDMGVIRTIDNAGRIQTIAGQPRNFGVGADSRSARYSRIEYFIINDDEVFVKNELENQIVKFNINGGNLELVAGNGIEGAAVSGQQAINAPLQNGGSSQPTSFYIDSISNRLYHRVWNLFSYIDLTSGLWNVSGTQIHHPSARQSYLGYNGTNLLTYSTRHANPGGEGTYLIEISLDGFNITPVAGTGDLIPPNTPTDLCDGVIATSCDIPGSLTAVFQSSAKSDNDISSWLITYYGRNYINRLPYGGGVTERYASTNQQISAFDYFDENNERLIIYCSTNGNLYKKNLTTNIESLIELPSSTIKCGGRSLYFNSTRQSIIFSFQQNNLWGIAEIDLN